jgi:hypothetical protein
MKRSSVVSVPLTQKALITGRTIFSAYYHLRRYSNSCPDNHGEARGRWEEDGRSRAGPFLPVPVSIGESTLNLAGWEEWIITKQLGKSKLREWFNLNAIFAWQITRIICLGRKLHRLSTQICEGCTDNSPILAEPADQAITRSFRQTVKWDTTDPGDSVSEYNQVLLLWGLTH